MHRPVSLAVVAVIVTASISIPAVSEASERSYPNLDVKTQPEGEGKRLVRVRNATSGVSNEERVRPPIEMNPSVVSWIEHTEPHAAIRNMPNEHDMALIRDHAVAKYLDSAIDIRMVGTSLQQLRTLRITSTSKVDDYKLIIMAIGNELLKTHFPDHHYKHYGAVTAFQIMKNKVMGDELFETWMQLLSRSNFPLNGIFEMMRYLITKTGGVTLDLSVYGYMAMGRVLLSRAPNTPLYVPILPNLTRLEQMSLERGVDPAKTKIWLQRLKGQHQTSGKSEDELLLEAVKRAMGEHLTLGQGE